VVNAKTVIFFRGTLQRGTADQTAQVWASGDRGFVSSFMASSTSSEAGVRPPASQSALCRRIRGRDFIRAFSFVDPMAKFLGIIPFLAGAVLSRGMEGLLIILIIFI